MTPLSKVTVFLKYRVPEKIVVDGLELKNVSKASMEFNPGQLPKLIVEIDCEHIETVEIND